MVLVHVPLCYLLNYKLFHIGSAYINLGSWSTLIAKIDFRSFALGFGAGIILLGVLHNIKPSSKNKHRILKANIQNYENEVYVFDCLLFSPHQMTWNTCYLDGNGTCLAPSCPFCNYKKFLRLIKSATISIKVCVYLITLEEVSNIIVDLFKNGVEVQIITDKQINYQASKSTYLTFLKAYIPIKVIKSAGIMHNKFLLIDNKTLITGSFNWTKEGLSRNFENALILHNCQIIVKYINYFNDLWESSP